MRESLDLRKIGKDFQTWYFIVRNDPDALTEIRQLLIGLLLCCALIYGGSTFLLEPKSVLLKQKQASRDDLRNSAPAQLTAALESRLDELQRRKKELEENIGMLSLKEAFLREQWTAQGDAEQFSKILFTLQANAPVSMEKNLQKLNLLESRSLDDFTIQPVHLAGRARFEDLYSYLHYLESRPEVSAIDHLLLEVAAKNENIAPEIRFEMTVSRTSLPEVP